MKKGVITQNSFYLLFHFFQIFPISNVKIVYFNQAKMTFGRFLLLITLNKKADIYSTYKDIYKHTATIFPQVID